KVLNQISSIEQTDGVITGRSAKWYEFFDNSSKLKTLVTNPEVRSNTVISIKGDENTIGAIKGAVKKEGFILGNGYGKWEKTTFRIANFPAHDEKDISSLKALLANYL